MNLLSVALTSSSPDAELFLLAKRAEDAILAVVEDAGRLPGFDVHEEKESSAADDDDEDSSVELGNLGTGGG
jgi:hypothetical protein